MPSSTHDKTPSNAPSPSKPASKSTTTIAPTPPLPRNWIPGSLTFPTHPRASPSRPAQASFSVSAMPPSTPAQSDTEDDDFGKLYLFPPLRGRTVSDTPPSPLLSESASRTPTLGTPYVSSSTSPVTPYEYPFAASPPSLLLSRSPTNATSSQSFTAPMSSYSFAQPRGSWPWERTSQARVNGSTSTASLHASPRMRVHSPTRSSSPVSPTIPVPPRLKQQLPRTATAGQVVSDILAPAGHHSVRVGPSHSTDDFLSVIDAKNTVSTSAHSPDRRPVDKDARFANSSDRLQSSSASRLPTRTDISSSVTLGLRSIPEANSPPLSSPPFSTSSQCPTPTTTTRSRPPLSPSSSRRVLPPGPPISDPQDSRSSPSKSARSDRSSSRKETRLEPSSESVSTPGTAGSVTPTQYYPQRPPGPVRTPSSSSTSSRLSLSSLDAHSPVHPALSRRIPNFVSPTSPPRPGLNRTATSPAALPPRNISAVGLAGVDATKEAIAARELQRNLRRQARRDSSGSRHRSQHSKADSVSYSAQYHSDSPALYNPQSPVGSAGSGSKKPRPVVTVTPRCSTPPPRPSLPPPPAPPKNEVPHGVAIAEPFKERAKPSMRPSRFVSVQLKSKDKGKENKTVKLEKSSSQRSSASSKGKEKATDPKREIESAPRDEVGIPDQSHRDSIVSISSIGSSITSSSTAPTSVSSGTLSGVEYHPDDCTPQALETSPLSGDATFDHSARSRELSFSSVSSASGTSSASSDISFSRLSVDAEVWGVSESTTIQGVGVGRTKSSHKHRRSRRRSTGSDEDGTVSVASKTTTPSPPDSFLSGSSPTPFIPGRVAKSETAPSRRPQLSSRGLSDPAFENVLRANPDFSPSPLDVVLASLGCFTRPRSRSFSTLARVHVPPERVEASILGSVASALGRGGGELEAGEVGGVKDGIEMVDEGLRKFERSGEAVKGGRRETHKGGGAGTATDDGGGDLGLRQSFSDSITPRAEAGPEND